MSERCENCRHGLAAYVVVHGSDLQKLACSRYPPRIVGAAGAVQVTEFPLVQPDWHCGEWGAKESSPDEPPGVATGDGLSSGGAILSRRVWMNVYWRKIFGTWHWRGYGYSSEAEADASAGEGLIACVELELPVEGGGG